MKRIVPFLRRVACARAGTSSVEYGFILAFIVLVIFIAIVQLADVTQRMWSDIHKRVTASSSSH
jgi:pilus assembly protein Flp/PilA